MGNCPAIRDDLRVPLHSLVVLPTCSRCRLIVLLSVLALGLASTQEASASNSIDVLALYTPLAKQELGGDHASVVAAMRDGWRVVQFPQQ